MSKRFEGQVVWITGGSSGLGRAMATEFARLGADVAVSARRIDRLAEVVAEIEATGQRGRAIPCDVTDDAAVAAAVAEVIESFGQLDVAVANAGYDVPGRVVDVSEEQWVRQFDVNVHGVVRTARHAVPHLEAAGGRLALVGSVAGTIASPGNGPYTASKYAVRAIGQVLAMELDDSPVTCTTIHPGMVDSEIARVDGDGNFREDWEDRRPASLRWPTDKAARTMVNAIYRREREFVFTAHGKLGAFIGKHMPGLVHFAATKFG